MQCKISKWCPYPAGKSGICRNCTNRPKYWESVGLDRAIKYQHRVWLANDRMEGIVSKGDVVDHTKQLRIEYAEKVDAGNAGKGKENTRSKRQGQKRARARKPRRNNRVHQAHGRRRPARRKGRVNKHQNG